MEISDNKSCIQDAFISVCHSVVCSLPILMLSQNAAFSRSCRARWSGLGPSPEDTLPHDLAVTVSAGRNSHYGKLVLGLAAGRGTRGRFAPPVLWSPGQCSSPHPGHWCSGEEISSPHPNAFFSESCACSPTLGTAPSPP